MPSLANQRCFFHAQREAALKCLGCGRFYCRECATEHDGRWLCSACLGQRLDQPQGGRPWLRGLLRAGGLLLALVCLWGAFYFVGAVLMAVPTPTHDSLLRPESLLE